MSARGFTRPRRVVGAALGIEGKVIDVHARCVCGAEHIEPMDPADTFRSDVLKRELALLTCLFCGRMGEMTRVRKAS